MALYTHDCDRCRYLGTTPNPRVCGEMLDHYVCENAETGTSLIARYSSEGRDYYSMPLDVVELLAREPNESATAVTLTLYKMFPTPVS